MLLTRGNSKLGSKAIPADQVIWSFNLPPGKEKTCFGESEICGKACYGKRGHWIWSKVQARLEKNWRASKQKGFVDAVCFEIQHRGVRRLRWHSNGDFYGLRYTKKAHQVAKRCPSTDFYWYSRSWIDPLVRRELEAFACLSNVQGWFSVDASMPHPENVPPWIRLAYLSTTGEEQLFEPERTLVFRTRKLRNRQPRKKHALSLICPLEQGISRKVSISCSSCSVCLPGGSYYSSERGNCDLVENNLQEGEAPAALL